MSGPFFTMESPDSSHQTTNGLSKHTGLPCIAPRNSALLILGSFPSRTALRTREYYANPQNAFWRLLSECLEPGSVLKGREEKREFLERHGIALWNVVARCERSGSSDSEIREAVLNDVPGLLLARPGIKKVLLNGRYPEKIWRVHFAGRTTVPGIYVPASSSQHARLSPREKAAAWKRHLRPACPVQCA